MLFDLKNPKHRKILLLLAIGAIAYSISSVLGYLVAVKLPVAITILSVQVGFLPCTIVLILLGRESVDLRPSKSNIAVWAYGLSFAFIGILLFSAYQNYSLASIFPLTEGGVLVFLALDFIFHGKKLEIKHMLLLVCGVTVVFLGTFLAESKGFTFNLSTLPYVVGIVLAGGIGYYALANKSGKISNGSKNLAFTIAALVSAGLLLLFSHVSLTSIETVPFIEGMVAGLFLCIAFSMEIRAVKHSMTGNEKKNVMIRNFINNFTELDTVIVLLASVAIGSYTYGGLEGGALIVVGVLILGMVS